MEKKQLSRRKHGTKASEGRAGLDEVSGRNSSL